MKIQWNDITSEAYKTLIEFGQSSFPLSFDEIHLNNILIVSFREYSRRTGAHIADFTCNNEYNDALYIGVTRTGISLIIYNTDLYDRRLRHTLLHEIGHVKLYHKKHGAVEEIEAHFFAAQANAPNVIIKAIAQRGYTIDAKLLMDFFGLSRESAEKKMGYLNEYAFAHSNQYDDIILQLFADTLDENFPKIPSSYDDDYYDDMESKRKNWN